LGFVCAYALGCIAPRCERERDAPNSVLLRLLMVRYRYDRFANEPKHCGRTLFKSAAIAGMQMQMTPTPDSMTPK
jgi:hypothetical protein